MHPVSRLIRLAGLALGILAVTAPAPSWADTAITAPVTEATTADTSAVTAVVEPMEPDMAANAEPGYYGYDGLRLTGGSGLTYTLGARALAESGLAAGGSLVGMWAPGWVRQRTDDLKLDGGLLRETANITKAFNDLELWASVSGTQTWRVTSETEKLSNLGDISLGVKYSLALGSAWNIAPFVVLRALSPVQDESSYSDSLSPEFGIALGWYGWSGKRQIPLALTMNLSYDYDRTLNLLTSETRANIPATPFERLNWGMSDFPFVHTRLGMEWLAPTHDVWSAELVGDVPLISNETSLSLGRYRGVIAWRKSIARDWLLVHAFVSGSAPVDSDIDVEQLPPYEAGVQLSIALGGFKHGRPGRDWEEAPLESTVPETMPVTAPTDGTASTDISAPVEGTGTTSAPETAPTTSAPAPADAPIGDQLPQAKPTGKPAKKPADKPKAAPSGANDYEQPIGDEDVYQ